MAKNTLLLYFRMLLLMLVSLYTVRVILKTLGVVDFGIYNVVAGIVIMFAFLSNSMASAAQRFFSFEIGRNDQTKLKQTFGLTLSIYVAIAIAVFVLAELIGIWFLNNRMNIPADRMVVANQVFHFSVLSFMITIIAIPFNALIIAYEQMKVYAYVSLAEAGLKLAIVFLLVYSPVDKLLTYAVLMLFTTGITQMLFVIYCRRSFDACRFRLLWDRGILKTLISYSGWNLLGALAAVVRDQGINILLNVFFGPIVNASRAVAYQVYSIINQFITTVYNATRPQITKYYAAKQESEMWSLVFSSTKLTYYIFLVLALPVLIDIEFILKIWLGSYPSFTPLFTRLVLIGFLLEVSVNQIIASLQAANRLKIFQLTAGFVQLLNIPVSYFLLKAGMGEAWPFYISIGLSVLYVAVIIVVASKEVQLSVPLFLREVTGILLLVTSISLSLPLLLHSYLPVGLPSFVMTSVVGFSIILVSVWMIGLKKTEKSVILNYIKKKTKNV